MVNDLLCHLDSHKSMGLDGIYPRVVRELAEGQNKWELLLSIYDNYMLRCFIPYVETIGL